jgi:hypothetical protein
MDAETLKERRTRIEARIKVLKETIRDKEGDLRIVDFKTLGLIYKQKSGKKAYSPKNVTVLKFNDHEESLGYSDWIEEGRVSVGKGISLYRRSMDVAEEEREIDISKVKNLSDFVKAVGLGKDEWIIVLLETTGEENMPIEAKAKVFKFGDLDPFVNNNKFLEHPDIVIDC